MNYEKLKDLVLTKLNNNNYGIIFDVDIFNSPEHDYEIEVNKENGYGVDVKRVVPTMISTPFGDNIPVPNTFGVDGSFDILFDIFVGDETKFIDKEDEEKFKSAGYFNTIYSIQDFITNNLSRVLPLGRSAIFFGGEDSTFSSSGSITPIDTIYIEFVPQDDYEESILKTDTIEIIKLNDGTISFSIDGINKNTTVQYSVGETNKLLLWNDGTNFYLNDDLVNFYNDTSENITTVELGNTTGLNAKVYDVRLGSTTLTYDTIDNVDDVSWNVLYADFEDIDAITNLGETVGEFDGTCDNCILWGEDGNFVLGFTTLVPIEPMSIDNEYKYQKFSLTVPFLFSKDIVFGNQFRYFLNLDPDNDGEFDDNDDFEVFAVNRKHSYGTETTSRQNILENIGKSMVNESMRDVSKTFIYKPERNLTKLLRKIMNDDVSQNKRYRIRVQAPFFKTDFECVVDGGGNGTELNTFSVFTVQFKETIKYD